LPQRARPIAERRTIGLSTLREWAATRSKAAAIRARV
jgi:hypothetical protein